MADPDFRTLFESAPGLYLVLVPDAPRFTIVAASDAYLRATMSEREAITGKPLFDVFPDNPRDPAATGTRNLRASLERVIHERKPDAMAVQKYDIRPRGDAGFEERFWSALNSPVLDDGGALIYIIHRVEDVTEFVRLKHGGTEMEAEIVLRGQQLQRANEALRDANKRLATIGEAQFRELFDSMPQLGWTARPDGFIDFYNKGWYRYTGTTPEEMEGWGWEKVHDPALLPAVVERWQQSLATGTLFEMEFPLRRHDGAFRWFLTRGTPLRDSDGNILRWVGINTDIHDRKQAGAAVDARLRLLIESIRDYAVFMLDTEGRIATWSAGAQQIKQYRADEIIGRHFSIFYPEVDNRAGKPAMELREATRVGRFEDEGWRLRKDGSRFWANVVISAVRDADGKLIGFSKVTRDLTERKRAEEERLQLAVAQGAEERFRFLAEASGLLSSSLDYATTLESVARLAVPRYGDWCSVELRGDDGRIVTVAVHHNDPTKVELARELQRRWPSDVNDKTGTANVLRTGQPELYPEIPDEMLVLGTKDAEHLRIARELKLRSALTVPIISRGQTIGALSLVWAETPRKYTREDLPLMEELGRRAGIAIENARLYRELQDAVRLRDEFLSIASHELKTPLTSLQLQVSGVVRSVGKGDRLDLDKLVKRVDVIDEQLERLTSLINSLLDVSRATAGQLRLDLGDVDLGGVVRDAAARLQDDFESVGCRVSVAVDDGLVGRWDRARLDQIVTNFLTNAIKYGAGKPIEVTARRSPRGTAVVSVRDEGIGIAPADRGRIFERFGRAVSPEHYGGLGLGLWIVKQSLDAMGGTVTVDSEPGRGSTFTAELPLASRTAGPPSIDPR